MSGGSYNYVSDKIEEAANDLEARHEEPHVVALAVHLRAIAKVMHDIEWADSGDTAWNDKLDDSIRALLHPAAELDEAVGVARRAYASLGRVLVRLENAGMGLPLAPPPPESRDPGVVVRTPVF